MIAFNATTAHQPVEFFITLFSKWWMDGDDDILSRTRDALSECASFLYTQIKKKVVVKNLQTNLLILQFKIDSKNLKLK